MDAAELQLIPCPMQSDESPISYAQRLRDMDIAGLILFEVFYAPLISALQTLRRPMVSLDTDLSSFDIPSVVVDNRLGTAIATKMCIEKGHTDIAFMGLPLKREFNNTKYYDPVTAERYDGYRMQMELCGLSSRQIDLPHKLRYTQGNAGLATLLMAEKRRPTAILFDSDCLARDLARGCIDAGMSIPEDISLCGFGYKNTKYAGSKKISRVYVNWAQMGRLGAELLEQLLRGDEGIAMKKMLPVQWVENDSCIDLT